MPIYNPHILEAIERQEYKNLYKIYINLLKNLYKNLWGGMCREHYQVRYAMLSTCSVDFHLLLT